MSSFVWHGLSLQQERMELHYLYSRPDGSNGASGKPLGQTNVPGAKGNNEFKSTEVREVNLFRNAMAGKSEYLRNPGKDSRILQIDRGTEGTVIINLKEESVNINPIQR